jgi:hypothetical protein
MIFSHVLSQFKPTKASFVVLFHPHQRLSCVKFSLHTLADYAMLSSRRSWSDNGIHAFRYINDSNYYQSVKHKIKPFNPPEIRNTSTLSNTATQNRKTVKIPKFDSKTQKQNIQRNHFILSLGQKHQWKDILLVYHFESTQFNDVNFSTTMSQLSKIKSFNKHDPTFIVLLDDLASQMQSKGQHWGTVRSWAMVVHAIAKMNLRSSGARRILSLATSSEVSMWLVEKGTPQSIANIAWACAKLGIKSPKMFEDIVNRAQWLVEKGNPQEIANTAWACARLGIKSPKIFDAIEK